MSMLNRKKLVSIQSFWMDRTEVTNGQYRKFVKYVADSLKYLAVFGGGVNQTEDTVKVDWNRALKINTNSKAVIEKLNELLLSPDNRIQGRIEIDPNKLIYKSIYLFLCLFIIDDNKMYRTSFQTMLLSFFKVNN